MSHILILIFLTMFVSSCGTNIFETFDDNENDTEDLVNQLEYATSDEDLNSIITNADLVISDETSTNSDKGEAQLVKAEAIVSKAGLSPLDVLGDIGETVDNPNVNNFNAIKIDKTKKSSLIEASKEIDKASSNGVTGTNDQNLMKGITNIGVVSSTVDEALTINDDGTVTRKDESKSYFQTLETAMYPDPTDTTKTTFDYASTGIDGLKDSESFTTDQNNQMTEIKQDIEKTKELHSAAKNGGTYTKSDGSTYDFTGTFDNSGDLSNESEQTFIEEELSKIFGN